MKFIYKVYKFLENNTTDNSRIEIAVTSVGNYKISSDSKYPTSTETVETIKNSRFGDTNFDFLDFLEYVFDRTSVTNDKEAFRNFLKEIEMEEKYKDILSNINTYQKKSIPFDLNRKIEVTYNDIKVIITYDFDNVNKFIDTLKNKKGIKTTILKQTTAEYDLMNTDFSHTEFKKYIMLDENKNLFFILEEINGSVDDVSCCLYFTTIEIPDNQIKDLLLYVDNYIKNTI